jgi:hypothetical protein
VGHRPNRLQNADLEKLGSVIREILEAVQAGVSDAAKTHRDEFAPDAPVLRAISPLAEGTDRLFAEQALALGWDLCCVMPFQQAEYEKDFVEGNALENNSLERFRRILKSADSKGRLTCMELAGLRSDETESYEVAGSVVLGLSDLLIAVWDGDRAQDRDGGTAETIDEAIQAGVPVVIIDAKSPHEWPMPRTGGLVDLAAIRDATLMIHR